MSVEQEVTAKLEPYIVVSRTSINITLVPIQGPYGPSNLSILDAPD